MNSMARIEALERADPRPGGEIADEFLGEQITNSVCRRWSKKS